MRMKLTEAQKKTIARKIKIAESRINSGMDYLDKITNQLQKYGLTNAVAEWHPADGIVFQLEGEPFNDMDLDGLLKVLDEKANTTPSENG